VLVTIVAQAFGQIFRIMDGPDLRSQPSTFQHFRSVDSRDAQSDVADVSVRSEVLVRENDAHYATSMDRSHLCTMSHCS
jgi:hypothetical protein